MVRRTIKFPDGRYGFFSTISDTFLFVGSRDEFVWFLRSQGYDSGQTTLSLEQADADAPTYGQPWPTHAPIDGYRRFREALGELALNRSEAKFQDEVAALKLLPEWQRVASDIYRRTQGGI